MLSSLFDTIATVKRLQAYSGSKSSYAETGDTYEGQFEPIQPDNNAIAMGIISQMYKFTTEHDADILEADKLEIDGVDYGVQGVSVYKNGSVEFLKVILQKAKK